MWSSEGHGRALEPRVCRKVRGEAPVVTILRQSQKGGTLTSGGHTKNRYNVIRHLFIVEILNLILLILS